MKALVSPQTEGISNQLSLDVNPLPIKMMRPFCRPPEKTTPVCLKTNLLFKDQLNLFHFDF
jgi:hypothetical protein